MGDLRGTGWQAHVPVGSVGIYRPADAGAAFRSGSKARTKGKARAKAGVTVATGTGIRTRTRTGT
ncbi:hypothetical protein [Thalassospira sp. MIT1370]|uniref:hypothetical protein n=1 Tax=unclassified Thalassospira TaxID=2648997 RepID=UPI00399B90E0